MYYKTYHIAMGTMKNKNKDKILLNQWFLTGGAWLLRGEADMTGESRGGGEALKKF